MKLILLALTQLSLVAADRHLEETILHLRSGAEPEWEQFAEVIPDGRELRVPFRAETNTAEQTLFLFQDDVKLDWRVELNGRRLGNLFLMEAPLVHHFAVPAGTLRDGDNELVIHPPKENDDIRVGRIRLRVRAWPDDPTQLDITVNDPALGENIPARITIVDTDGALTPVRASTEQRLALRPGVIYTANGTAKVHVLPGQYTVYATRGFEYGLDQKTVTVSTGATARVLLQISREVSTPGLVSCDTHTHTFTHSRHGDATIEERVITLAGEGIELPVATDHNTLSDYSAAAVRMGVDRYFTPVIGDEVTTQTAHFNAFPIAPDSRLPNFRLQDGSALLNSIRRTPNVEVVILNHPHNVHNGFEPFSPEHFDARLGLPRAGLALGFDAIELVNSSALQSDMWQIFEDWFALLNAGERVVGVGSSDVHDVSRYIVGQGRTYIRCPDADPGRIDVGAACRALRQGRAMVSMGLLVDLTVNGKFAVGDLVPVGEPTLTVEARVSAPSWIRPNRLELFANGVRIQDAALEPSTSGEVLLRWSLPKPAHDVHLVAVASGPPVTGLYWAIPRPYQSRSSVWQPKVIGCTNPIWIDSDGDGKFTSAREYAVQLVKRYKDDPAALARELAKYDAAVAVHAASLSR